MTITNHMKRQHTLDRLFAFPIAAGTLGTTILTALTGGAMAAAFGFLIVTVITGSTNAATGRIFTRID
jgi:hypothetical protein